MNDHIEKLIDKNNREIWGFVKIGGNILAYALMVLFAAALLGYVVLAINSLIEVFS